MSLERCCNQVMEKVGVDKDPILGPRVDLKCKKCGKLGSVKLDEYEIAKRIEEAEVDDLGWICG